MQNPGSTVSLCTGVPHWRRSLCTYRHSATVPYPVSLLPC